MNCQLSNINQTSSMKSFNIVPFQEPFAIKGVYIICSKMETLTEDVCKALPYVKNFHAEQLGLAFVEQNAFQKCTKVEVISLYGNSLKKLPFGLFDSNVQLSVVQLAVNKLMEIDGNMFKNNPKLEQLHLSNSSLQEFSFSNKMPILTTINLSNNQLSDVDTQMLLENCPILREIHLDIGKCIDSGVLSTTQSTTQNITTSYTEPLITQKLRSEFKKLENSKTTLGTPQTALLDENIEDLKEQVTDLRNKHSTSNLIIIIMVSILTISILGLGVYWLKKKFWNRPDQPSV